MFSGISLIGTCTSCEDAAEIIDAGVDGWNYGRGRSRSSEETADLKSQDNSNDEASESSSLNNSIETQD